MADNPQNLRWAQYEAVTIAVTMSANGSISGHTHAFTVKRPSGTAVLSKTTGDGSIAVTTTGSGSTPGVFTITLSASVTGTVAAGNDYEYDIWRTNSGSEARLAYGPLHVDKQLRT
jgi:hypothetical protein